MKQIFSLILVMLAIAIPSVAKESNGSPSSEKTKIEIYRKSKDSSSKVSRAPMRINIEAYYDAESHSINIYYDGEADGEVFLYLDEALVGYDSDLNTSFQVTTPGSYKLEIVGETWVAQGSIQL